MREVEFRIVDASEAILLALQDLDQLLPRCHSAGVALSIARALRVYAEKCGRLESAALNQVDRITDAESRTVGVTAVERTDR